MRHVILAKRQENLENKNFFPFLKKRWPDVVKHLKIDLISLYKIGAIKDQLDYNFETQILSY